MRLSRVLLRKTLINQQVDKWVTVGNIGRVHGIQGWVKIISYTAPLENILRYKPWYLLLEQEWKVCTITQSKSSGNSILVKLENCDTPEQAKKYVNVKIGIRREQLPALPEGQYYWADLQGLTVYNTHGQYLGLVDHLFATGANDVMVVKREKKEIWIPYLTERVILKIDLLAKKAIVAWDEEE